MNFQQQYFTVKPLEFDLFCGMDVDKKSISITFVSHEGFVKSLKIPHDSANLIQYVRRRFPDKRIAFVYEPVPQDLAASSPKNCGEGNSKESMFRTVFTGT